MKTIYKYLPMAALAAMQLLSACDTTEDGFHPDSKEGIHWEFAKTKLTFGAQDGATDTIMIKNSSVGWKITGNDGHFKFTPDEGEGDGMVFVTAEGNDNDSPWKGTLTVTPLNAEGVLADQTISLDQNIVIFPTEITDFDMSEFPESGDTRSIKILSTINWEFVDPGDTDIPAVIPEGFDITPGKAGKGKYGEQTISFTWQPNYTRQSRSVSLQMTPEDDQYKARYAGKPKSFTLTQATGTLPKNVALAIGTPGYTDVELTLSFESVAPVESCGVTIRDDSGAETVRTAPLASEDSREVKWTINGLTEGARYTVTPFVVSKVGRTDGSEQTVYMDAHVKLPEITGVTYDVTSRSVTANVSFDGQVEVTNVGLEIYDDATSSTPLVTYTSERFSKRSGTESVSSATFMSPNKDYTVRSFVIYTFDGEEKTLYADKVKIHTPAVIPGEDDNIVIE